MAAVEREFDYLAVDAAATRVGTRGHAGSSDDLEVGSPVRVPLHGRRVAGWVVAKDVEPPPGVRLLPLAARRGIGPAPDVVELSAWAAWRWAGRRSAFLRTASPPRFVYELPRPGRWAGRVPGAGHSAAEADAAAESALGYERAVLRLAPAAPRSGILRAAARLGRDGGSVLVLCPALSDAERAARILGADGIPVALMPDQWAEAAAGGRVVVGARAAAWAPAPGLRAVVVLDGHEEVYTEERAPTWNAWQVAAERARRAGASCVVASASPSLELLEWGTLVTYPRAVERAAWPVVEVLDRRGDDPRSGLLSSRVADVVRDPEAVAGRPVVCVLNRKGRARLLACRKCGELARCELCGAALSLGADELSCPGCGARRPIVCLECGSTRLSSLRKGVTRLAEELAALAGRPVAEISSDRESGWEGAAVIIGTEAALHRVRRAAAVVFLDFDQELTAPRYRAGEEALALLARAGRLVGGRGAESAGRRGRVVVQTRLPDHEVLTAAVNADPGVWSEAEQERRRALGLPPFAALALVSGPGAAELAAASSLDAAPLGEDRFLLRAAEHDVLCDALARARAGGTAARIEMDPLRV